MRNSRVPANAHTPNDNGRWQPLAEHLDNVARLTADFGTAFGAEDAGYWLGLWHDIGKYSAAFQDYLKACAANPGGHQRGPDHKAAGTSIAVSKLGPLALLIQGHHGGLQTKTEMMTWLKTKESDTPIEEALALARADIPNLEPAEPISVPAWIRHDPLAAELFLRLLYSALVDADSLDTEHHWRPEVSAKRGRHTTMDDLWQRFNDDQRSFTQGESSFGQSQAVKDVRNAVYRDCLTAAESPAGLFRLNVPTGGGKTRSGMAFALRHALHNQQQRIIVAVPFITITEQTAETYRGIFERPGDPAPVILEHHSGAQQSGDDEDFQQNAVWKRLAAENWDAPIVVTTTVQLFESLFSNMRGKSRKLHRLANCVIILDEAQALPATLLDPILHALRELCEHYGTTVVLSTATQPAFDAVPVFNTLPATDIVRNAGQLYDRLRRVTYEWQTESKLDWVDVADLMRSEEQSLVVLNTKADALALLDALDDSDALHLSTLLCGAHRRKVIATVRDCLRQGQPCRLVSTQVIEAGVDLDFPLVLRALGPLDAIIQSAGRCNREGRLERGRVIVFEPEVMRLPKGSYQRATGVTQSLVNRGNLDPDDPNTVDTYFRRWFGIEATDDKVIQPLRQALNYPRVAEEFRMIEPSENVVITRYGTDDDQRRVLRCLDELRHGTPRSRFLLRELQPFMVSLPVYQAEYYRSRQLISPILPGIGVWHGRYDETRGIVAETGEAYIV
jgi:CRISPR-associated endonuclease/helicase Cas3